MSFYRLDFFWTAVRNFCPLNFCQFDGLDLARDLGVNIYMNFKVTVLKDVIIRINVPCIGTKDLGDGAKINHPSEREEWVELKAGEVRENLHLLKGVHPSCVPNQRPINLHGVSVVVPPSWGMQDLPKNFFGLFILDHYPPMSPPV